MNKIAYIVLQEIDEFWDRALSINQITLIFQIVYQILQLFISSCILQNMCLNYVHIY